MLSLKKKKKKAFQNTIEKLRGGEGRWCKVRGNVYETAY